MFGNFAKYFKIQAITEKPQPRKLKELGEFLCAVNQFIKLVPHLASICFPFRSLLKRKPVWNLSTVHGKAFQTVNGK